MEIQDVISYIAKEIAKYIPVQETKEAEEVMTIKDMEQFLQIGRSKSYELIKMEGFPVYKVGIEYRILKSELVEWMKTQKDVQ